MIAEQLLNTDNTDNTDSTDLTDHAISENQWSSVLLTTRFAPSREEFCEKTELCVRLPQIRLLFSMSPGTVISTVGEESRESGILSRSGEIPRMFAAQSRLREFYENQTAAEACGKTFPSLDTAENCHLDRRRRIPRSGSLRLAERSRQCVHLPYSYEAFYPDL